MCEREIERKKKWREVPGTFPAFPDSLIEMRYFGDEWINFLLETIMMHFHPVTIRFEIRISY